MRSGSSNRSASTRTRSPTNPNPNPLPLTLTRSASTRMSAPMTTSGRATPVLVATRRRAPSCDGSSLPPWTAARAVRRAAATGACAGIGRARRGRRRRRAAARVGCCARRALPRRTRERGLASSGQWSPGTVMTHNRPLPSDLRGSKHTPYRITSRATPSCASGRRRERPRHSPHTPDPDARGKRCIRVGLRSPGSAHLASVYKKENGSTAVHTLDTHTRTHHLVSEPKSNSKTKYRYAVVRM